MSARKTLAEQLEELGAALEDLRAAFRETFGPPLEDLMRRRWPVYLAAAVAIALVIVGAASDPELRP